MNRRDFMNKSAAIAALGFTAEMTLMQRADAFEAVMAEGLTREVLKPPLLCNPEEARSMAPPGQAGPGGAAKQKLMAPMHDPRLIPMPEKPTLADFYRYRIPNPAHGLQSAKLAKDKGLSEKVILACLLHDISVETLIRTDHGFWGAQLVAPYVDEEVSWAIQKHQTLRFFADKSVGYDYPKKYKEWFGEDYKVGSWIQKEYDEAKNHKWYMTARLITLNDLYAFDPEMGEISIDEFEGVIARNFKQPKEGLGFDGSPSAHMWRTLIWPNSFL